MAEDSGSVKEAVLRKVEIKKGTEYQNEELIREIDNSSLHSLKRILKSYFELESNSNSELLEGNVADEGSGLRC